MLNGSIYLAEKENRDYIAVRTFKATRVNVFSHLQNWNIYRKNLKEKFRVTCSKRYFSQTIWGIWLKFIHNASMDPVLGITGCSPGGATYHGCGYKVISDIFTKIAISSKVLTGFYLDLYNRWCVYIGSIPGGATCDIWDFTGVLRFQWHFANSIIIMICSLWPISSSWKSNHDTPPIPGWATLSLTVSVVMRAVIDVHSSSFKAT